MKWLARMLAKIMDFLFGCRHQNLSWVFTLDGQTYRVCWDCGARFTYSLANMSIMHRIPGPRTPALGHVNTAAVLNSGDMSCYGLNSRMPRTL